MRKLLAALTIATSLSAVAQSTTATPASSSTTLDSALAKIKSLPISSMILVDAYTNSLKENQGANAETYFYFNYKVDKYHKITVTPILSHVGDKTHTDKNQVYTEYLQTDLNFSRSKILTEEKNGVNLSASLGNSFYANNKFNPDTQTGIRYSRHHASLSANKTWGSLTLSSGLTQYVYNRNTGSVNSTGNYTTLSLTPTWTFNDNLSVSGAFLWYKLRATDKYSNGHENNEQLRFVPSIDGAIGKLGLSVYFDTYMAYSHDRYSALNRQWLKEGSVGLNFTYSLF